MIKIELHCTPTAQARPRHGKFGTYKAKSQKLNEVTLAALLAPYQPGEPIEGPVMIRIEAALKIPKSRPKKWKAAAEAGHILPTTKPDVDNLAKQILDAMTRLQFWEDDKQVVSLQVVKRYSTRPCWTIHLEEVQLQDCLIKPDSRLGSFKSAPSTGKVSRGPFP